MSRSSRRPVRPPVDPAAPSSEQPRWARNGSQPIEGAVAGYRMLRRIASGDRVDVYLATVDPGDELERPDPDTPPVARPLVALRVYDASASDEVIATEIEVMASDASGSTPALLDVAALDDGRTCLAVERLPGPALAQLLGERSFLAGETVTLLAAIVQAVRELERCGFVHCRLSAADILLDERGRPRVIGLGSVRRLAEVPAGPDRVALLREGATALLRLVEDVASATIPAGALAGCEEVIRASLDRRPFESCGEQLERAIFDVAPAAPISGVGAPGRVSLVPARVPRAAAAAHVAEEPEPGDRQVGGAPSTTRLRQMASLAQVPAHLVDEFAAAADELSTRALRGRVAAIVSSRRRQLLVAAGAGAAVLAALLTLVPPGGGTASVAESEQVADAAATPSEPADRSVGVLDTSAVGGEVDPVVAAAELLEVRASCLAARDLDCVGAVAQAGSPIAASDRAATLAADGDLALDAFDLGAITLVADMGSAVLLDVPYAGPEREPASLLVMRSEAGWRLRELFD